MKPVDRVAAGQAAVAIDAHCTLDLPKDFRTHDFRAFHARDGAALAERLQDDTLYKGILWQGRPALLRIHFESGRALATLTVDGDPPGAQVFLDTLARRMLGLTQNVEEFEERHRAHPLLGPLIARNRGLRIPLSASPFEALVWAITGQQISVSAAIAIRRRLIEAAGPRHSSGLRCHPDAARILALGEERLRLAGFSSAKTRSLLVLCEEVESGTLPLEDGFNQWPVDEIRERLLRLRGIGPWTVNYALLRGFGWLDGSLHGDVAVRRNLQSLLGRAERLTEEETRQWLAPFSPWRALLAAHLWAMQSAQGF